MGKLTIVSLVFVKYLGLYTTLKSSKQKSYIGTDIMKIKQISAMRTQVD